MARRCWERAKGWRKKAGRRQKREWTWSRREVEEKKRRRMEKKESGSDGHSAVAWQVEDRCGEAVHDWQAS